MNTVDVAAGLVPTLFEDEHYLFVHKPAGLSVNTPRKGLAWGVVELLERLAGRDSQLTLHPCYRLEKYVSGVLALAKSAAAAERFRSLVSGGAVERRFVAVTRGKPVKSPKRNEPAHPRGGGRAGGESKDATLSVETVTSCDNAVVVRLTPTGRGKVRVRAAMAAMRLPVLGDVEFGVRTNKTQSGRYYLHLESTTFKHPDTGEPVHVYAPVPPSFEAAARGDAPMAAHLEVALASRAPYLIDGDTNACRLLNAKVDGVPGLLADRYGDLVVLQTVQGKFNGDIDTVRAAAKWFGGRIGVHCAYLKNIPHDRSRPRTGTATDATLTDPSPLWGKPAEPEVSIRENGIGYLIRPYDGFLVGLFLDHRENRLRIRHLAEGKRVLNLFSYTCGFSVSAAVGGAASTVSVDISKKFLEWGKRNFETNGIALDDHRFYCSDVFEYFKRADKHAQRFDLIIADPPTFARTKKPPTVFQIDKDMVRLVAGALRLLEADGVMLVSTNHRELSTGWLREQIQSAAGKRRFRILESPDLPPDYIGSRDANKTVIVRF